MLARPTNVSAKQAAYYYEKDDYYSQEKDSQRSSYWYGKGAENLGLSGEVASQDFQQMLEGRSPQGKRLHAKPIDPDKHRAGTDYTFNASKSVSIAALVQGDWRLAEAHNQAVRSPLEILEERYTRARAWNPQTRQQDKVFTGNVAIAVYPHQINRNGDPHLHNHAVGINATQDGWRWKAASNELVVQNQKLLGQIYQNDLAYQARQLGYEIDIKEHGQFELRNYPEKTLAAFSTRRQEIKSHVNQFGESESVKTYQRAALQTRSRKTVLTQEEKRDRWQSTIDQKQLELPPIPEARNIEPIEPAMLVHQAIGKLAEAEVTFRREQLEQHILENSLGQCKFREIEIAINQSPDLVKYGDRFTTRNRLERLNQLEELLGLDYATHKTRETEESRGIVQTASSRDPSRAIGNRVAERLAATLPASSQTRRNSEQVDRCVERVGEPESAARIDFEAVARGVTAIRDRAALRWFGEEITATLESVSHNLAEFERVSQQLNQLVEGYRDRLATREAERPLSGSPEWSHAEFVLGYSEVTLKGNNQIWAENNHYWAERNPDSGEVRVGRKRDNQIIAQGKLNSSGWDITIAKVEDDWLEFVKRQQQRELEQQQINQQKSIGSKERSPGSFEME